LVDAEEIQRDGSPRTEYTISLEMNSENLDEACHNMHDKYYVQIKA